MPLMLTRELIKPNYDPNYDNRASAFSRVRRLGTTVNSPILFPTPSEWEAMYLAIPETIGSVENVQMVRNLDIRTACGIPPTYTPNDARALVAFQTALNIYAVARQNFGLAVNHKIDFIRVLPTGCGGIPVLEAVFRGRALINMPVITFASFAVNLRENNNATAWNVVIDFYNSLPRIRQLMNPAWARRPVVTRGRRQGSGGRIQRAPGTFIANNYSDPTTETISGHLATEYFGRSADDGISPQMLSRLLDQKRNRISPEVRDLIYELLVADDIHSGQTSE